MLNSNIEELSALELSSLIKNKELSCKETLKYFEKRIKERNPSLNAFVYTKFDEAYKKGDVLDNKKEKEGAFFGVPFAIKDFLPGKIGWETSHGGVKSLIKTDIYSSEFTIAMENEGGIAVGKTNAPAFGFRGTCDNALYGPTCNPFNTEYNSGGSSGGSAASVADGLIPIAEGSDGGGSIRIPSAWCNLFGFKPSFGMIPSVSRPDAWAASHPYCSDGCVSKTVEDSATLFEKMAKYNPNDPMSYKRENKDYLKLLKDGIKGLKIGYTDDYGIFPCDDEVRKIVRESAYSLKECGAIVEEASFNIKRSAYELSELWCESISFDTAVELELMKREGLDLIKDHSSELPKEFIYWNEKVSKNTIMDQYRINVIRTEMFDMQKEAFDKYDLIISPTTICLPVKNENNHNTLGPKTVNGVECERIIGFCETFMFNFTGNPSASIPCPLSKDGLPIGMQITGRRMEDELVLKASKAYENIRPWRNNYSIALKRNI